jgi:hypothetical protein
LEAALAHQDTDRPGRALIRALNVLAAFGPPLLNSKRFALSRSSRCHLVIVSGFVSCGAGCSSRSLPEFQTVVVAWLVW